jgi:hypothetical protein
LEQNSRKRKKSEIVGDETHIQTERSDIDGDGAAKRQKSKNNRGLEVTLLAPSENYTVDGKLVKTGRFRAEEQGQQVFEFEMYKGVLIDETVRVSSFPDLTNIFEETFVNKFSRRKEGDTLDSAEREAWEAELKHITASQFGQSTFTTDQIRNNTQNRAKSKHARKFARGVNHIHTDDARKPPSLFIALARTTSYKEGLMTLMTPRTPTPYTCTSTAFLPPPKEQTTALSADSGPQPKPKLPMTVMQQTRRYHCR